MATAKKIDADRTAGKTLGVLAGLPIVVKDNINTKGLKTTGGTYSLRNFQPATNAPSLQKLIDAGAIVLGKSNLHEWAFGITSTNFTLGRNADGSASKPRPGAEMETNTLTRGRAVPAPKSSSSPSIWVITVWFRNCRSCGPLGRSCKVCNKALPALASGAPELDHNTTSSTPNCSRKRSSANPDDTPCASTSWTAAWRVFWPRSLANVSSEVRPRFKPAASAPSTLVSNQASIERDTN